MALSTSYKYINLERMVSINKLKTYKIHNSIYTEIKDDKYDILQTYNKKYKMIINLRFPKQSESLDKM